MVIAKPCLSKMNVASVVWVSADCLFEAVSPVVPFNSGEVSKPDGLGSV